MIRLGGNLGRLRDHLKGNENSENEKRTFRKQRGVSL
jgi:hypothetical protein